MYPSYLVPYTRTVADLVHLDADAALGLGLPGPGWLLTRLNTPEANRRQGGATEVMRLVLADADREVVTLYVEIMASGTMSNRSLRAWYGRLGFRHGNHYMRRDPR